MMKISASGQEALDALLADLDLLRDDAPITQREAQPLDLSDAQLLDIASAASNGTRFAALWEGDLSAYDNDQSRADLAMCCHLAFYTGWDAPRMDRLFRASGLMRDKWDRDDYREHTIQRAISATSVCYSGNASKAIQAIDDRDKDDSDDEAADSEENRGRGPSQGTLIVRMVSSLPGAALFHTAQGEAFASVPVNGHIETWPIHSAGFTRWLRNLYYTRCDASPGENGVKEARATLEGIAQFSGDERSVSIRLAERDGDYYLDLGDRDWRAVRISTSGWEIVSDPPVHFRRSDAIQPLPAPVHGGSLGDLRGFVNVGDSEWVLLTSWLLAAYRPVSATPFPYPLLSLYGEQGSAKTTTARILRSLVDPNHADVRAEPREARDLAVAAKGSWVLAYDNLDHVQPWFSNALCRLSTGGAFAVRSLYTNDEEAIFAAQRPVILTGIEEVVSRGDLLDRSLLISLPVIHKSNRRAEKAMWADFEAKHPAILGALLDAVVAAKVALPGVALAELPRMADFALWATAGETALGHAKGAFAKAYASQQTNANQVALESSLVATVLLPWWAKRSQPFTGSASDLLEALEKEAGEKAKRREWPKSARGLAGELKRIAPNLRAVGINVSQGDRTNKSRSLTIEKAAEPSPSSPPSQQGNQAGSGSDDSGDGWTTGRDGNRHANRHRPDTLEFVPGDGSDVGDGRAAINMNGCPDSPDGRHEYSMLRATPTGPLLCVHCTQPQVA